VTEDLTKDGEKRGRGAKAEERPPLGRAAGDPLLAGAAGPATDSIAKRIGGLSVLKGLVLYGATLTFAGFYAYFMYEIASASTNTPPHLSTAMVSAAAALAGVLGSAFALVVGVPADVTNEDLEDALTTAKTTGKKRKRTLLRAVFSLEPGRQDLPSWPLSFGIWMYAAVASAVAIVYLLNQGETPPGIKALAIAFAGYVVAFMTAAYGVASKK
jgi:hypothetical protein